MPIQHELLPQARRLVVASGLVDELPDVPGVRERWGRDVLHCPYCHGWEVRHQPVGVLATGPMAIHQTMLFRQWTDDLVLFPHGGAAPTPEQAEQLAARGVRVVPGTVATLEIVDDRLTGVRLEDGTVVPRRAVVVGSRMVACSSLLESLGLRTVPHPSGMGASFTADATGRTDVPGVWLAGNVTDLSAQVLPAAARTAVPAGA